MLPVLVRFRDLKQRNIVRSWAQLKNMVENEGFPPGRRTSPNIRTWTENEVCDWYNSRPIEAVRLRGYAKKKKAARPAACPENEGG